MLVKKKKSEFSELVWTEYRQDNVELKKALYNIYFVIRMFWFLHIR